MLFPIVSGLIQRLQGPLGLEMPWYQEFLNNGFGVLQRIAATVLFVPIGVLGGYLINTVGRDEPASCSS